MFDCQFLANPKPIVRSARQSNNCPGATISMAVSVRNIQLVERTKLRDFTDNDLGNLGSSFRKSLMIMVVGNIQVYQERKLIQVYQEVKLIQVWH